MVIKIPTVPCIPHFHFVSTEYSPHIMLCPLGEGNTHHMGQDFLCLSCSLGERAPHLFIPRQGGHQRAQNKGKPGLNVESLGTILPLLAHYQPLCSSLYAPCRRYQMLTPAPGAAPSRRDGGTDSGAV